MKQLKNDKDMLGNVIKCKWIFMIIEMIENGINRPGAMVIREQEGLTAKVLNEKLRKLVRFNILSKHILSDVPPKVVYSLTEFGIKFSQIVKQFKNLQNEYQDSIQ